MALYKGFDKDNFMEYLEENFDGFCGRSCDYARELVEGIIDYAYKWNHLTKDNIAEFISDVIPFVSFGEVAMFCEDAILTDYGKEQKWMELVKNGLPITDTGHLN